jgi:hypothetical protein
MRDVRDLGPGSPRRQPEDLLHEGEEDLQGRDEIGSFVQHRDLTSSEEVLKNRLVVSFTISASVPVPRAGWFGDLADAEVLKPICSRELHSQATFSGGAAIGGQSISDTSGKGSEESFGEKMFSRGDGYRRSTVFRGEFDRRSTNFRGIKRRRSRRSRPIPSDCPVRLLEESCFQGIDVNFGVNCTIEKMNVDRKLIPIAPQHIMLIRGNFAVGAIAA